MKGNPTDSGGFQLKSHSDNTSSVVDSTNETKGSCRDRFRAFRCRVRDSCRKGGSTRVMLRQLISAGQCFARTVVEAVCLGVCSAGLLILIGPGLYIAEVIIDVFDIRDKDQKEILRRVLACLSGVHVTIGLLSLLSQRINISRRELPLPSSESQSRRP